MDDTSCSLHTSATAFNLIWPSQGETSNLYSCNDLPAAACEFPVKFAVCMVALTPLSMRDAGALAFRFTKLELTMDRV